MKKQKLTSRKSLTAKQIKRIKEQKILELIEPAKRAKQLGDRPFIFHFLTTLKCNANCETCLWKDNKISNELTFDEIKRIYKEAEEEGFKITLLWGGEPLVRKDITDIIKFARYEANFPFFGMVTNGWFLPKRIHEFGEELDLILMSLDSPKKEEHDKIRGVKGLYDRIMKSVEIIKEQYPIISLQFSFSISKFNYHRIDEMIELADKLDIPVAFNAINTLRHYSTGIVDEKGELSVTDEEISDAFSRILKAKQDGSNILNSEMYLKHFIGGKKTYRCHARKCFMYVDSLGNIEDCLQLDKPIANLREMSLKDAMNLPRFKQYIKDAENCWTCNSPTMIDTSYIWDDFSLMVKSGGISFG